MSKAPAKLALPKLVLPRTRDLGGFSVRRVLPAPDQRAVGPFVFFDHIGPVTFAPGQGIDVAPHPHIGLATVTYLFEGEFVHRDSLGSLQPIRPGDVNWMTAGRGIVHSERTAPEQRGAGPRLHAVQSWLALPKDHEDCAPAFHHHPAATLPLFSKDDVEIRVIAGHAYGYRSPVRVFSETLYVDARMPARSRLRLPGEHAERAVYVATGGVSAFGHAIPAERLAVFAAGDDVIVTAETDSRIVVLGGAPLDGPRIVWWNFVASRNDRIEQAKERWRANGFGTIPGETERIPLPDQGPA
ncbi:MAG: pirin family protein [Alphaproteobacteria bacterium]